MMDGIVTDIWKKYESGVQHHNSKDMYAKTERCHRFYIGDQWYEALLSSADGRVKITPPMVNIIKPVGKYKISMVAQNNMGIVFSDMSGDDGRGRICEALNALAASTWEKAKMDTVAWETIKNAFIAGDHYAYWHDDRDQYGGSIVANLKPSLKCRLINKTNIYFADEQNPNLQEQEYIIISERLPVRTIRRQAKENGIPSEQLELIVSDEETGEQIGESAESEVRTEDGKCVSLLYMCKNGGVVHFGRAVKGVVYQPLRPVEGLDTYPVAGLRWESFIGTARGISGVEAMIPNQTLINRTEAWRSECVKRFAFPKPVYVESAIVNPEDMDVVGAAIKLNFGSAESLRSYVDYISPQHISSDAEKLFAELVSVTREVEGAGDAATGTVDPTRASGEAIKAARDQAAVPLNEQVAAYKQYIEDTAMIWLKLWTAGAVNGLCVEMDGENVSIAYEDLQGMDIDIKIDVTPVDPYSRVAREVLMKELYQSGAITLEEYASTLSDTSSMPKKELQAILGRRKEQINTDALAMPKENTRMEEQAMPLLGGEVIPT